MRMDSDTTQLVPRVSGVLLLLLRVVAGEDLGELVGPGDDRGGVQAPRLAGKPLDGPRDGDRGDDAARRPAHRRGDRSDAGLALADALCPAAAAHAGEGGG